MSEVNCLLVDDDPDDRDFFEIALKTVPYSVKYLSACEGSTGLDLVNKSEKKPDYIFLDLNMPLLTGKEFLSKIRCMDGCQDIPIIILSTSSYSGDIEECKKLGATHFMTKVPSVKKLSESICNIFSGNKLPYVLNSNPI